MSRPVVEMSDIGGVTVVRFVDVALIDLAKIEQIGNTLNALPNEQNRTKILVNFKGVQGINSWMIGKMLLLKGILSKRGGKLLCCEVGPDLMEVFVVSGLDRVIPIVPDEATGLKAF